VSAERPAVVKRQHRRHLPAEPRKGSQIEITAVEVVTVHEVRPRREHVEKVVGTGKLKVFPSPPLIQERSWMRGKPK